MSSPLFSPGRAIFALVLAGLSLAPFARAGEVPAQPLATKGEELFHDDFERADLGAWKTVIPSFAIEAGALKGWQTRADHGAVGRIHRPMRDVIVEFRFQLAGSTGFNAVFDDQKWKGSHAGHICRVAFAPNLIRLGDDKEGVMRNDIYEMRKDPAKKAAADQLIAARSTTARVPIDPQAWHAVTIEVVGDQMRVSLDGRAAAYLKSPGLAHETKSSLHFTVNGAGVLFDDLHIWRAE